jgi:hypothetical protein
MDTSPPQASPPTTKPDRSPDPAGLDALGSTVTRRGFLRGAALAGTGLVAATVAACAPAAAPSWSFAAPPQPPPATPPAPQPTPTGMPGMTMPPGPTPTHSGPGGAVPAGWTEHDLKARDVVRRYLGSLVPALEGVYGREIFGALADILGAADSYPELGQVPAFAQLPQLVINDIVKPVRPTLDGQVKVFELTVEEMDWRIDDKMAPVKALGYNAQWPGPTIRVTEDDLVRITFKNNLRETTVVHFHGVDFDDFLMDGVAFVTQKPIPPGESFTYEFRARPAGSMMYHSHHNATDQVGRGLLGAFIIEPKDDPDPVRAYEKRYGVGYDREYIWISNDTLGGFTINGHGFPAVVPVLAAIGERVLVRYMNEGIMMHPWHSHGYTQKIVARDGRPLGAASFECDTFGVNPGERIDAVITCDRPGVWAYHCHILPHAEGPDGMFGMVTALVVVPERQHVDAIYKALGIG